jgi:O-antigen/teichoic acid export membrane protein
VQFRNLGDDDLNACFWLTVIIGAVTYGLLCSAAPRIAFWMDMPELAPLLRVVGLILPLGGCRIVPEGLLRRRLEVDKLARAEILGATLAIPLVLGLAIAGAGVWALAASALLLPLIQAIGAYRYSRWRPSVQFRAARIDEFFRFSVAAMGTNLCAAAYQQTDMLILGKMRGDVAVGLFSMAKQLALLPAEKLSGMVNQLAHPVMSELQGDRDRLRKCFLRELRMIACVSMPVCVGVALVAEDLVQFVLGEKWAGTIPLLRLLCGYGLVRSLDVLLPPVLVARYRVKFLFWYVTGLLAVMPLAFWIGSASIGAPGVALAWLLVYPMVALRMARETLSELDISLLTVWAELRVVTWVTVAMVTVVITARLLMSEFALADHGLRLTVSVIVGLIAYTAGILWRGRALTDELVEMAGWLVLRRRRLPVP